MARVWCGVPKGGSPEGRKRRVKEGMWRRKVRIKEGGKDQNRVQDEELKKRRKERRRNGRRMHVGERGSIKKGGKKNDEDGGGREG